MPTPQKIQSFSDLFLSGLWKTLWIVLITPVENCGKAEKSNGYVTCAPRMNGKWNTSMPADNGSFRAARHLRGPAQNNRYLVFQEFSSRKASLLASAAAHLRQR